MRTSRTNSERAHGRESDRGLTMKERAKEARHAAYILAKERKKNDPRRAELKAKSKQARRAANAKAKERHKNDPAQVAFKAKLKKDRQDARRPAKDQRETRASATKKAQRAATHARLKVALAFASEYRSQPEGLAPADPSLKPVQS